MCKTQVGIRNQKEWSVSSTTCYSQVPGVDFTETYAPVVNDITVQILLIILILWKLHSILIDVEMAFLHGILKGGGEIFMDCPEAANGM
jgi:histone deacetylase 1/2